MGDFTDYASVAEVGPGHGALTNGYYKKTSLILKS
jgi:16S rRNA A1518/A1519 N6-dimethyltransferase RsmA/KsgA/DIM1 with predicted DNA glycosylase/AP lyase activity